MASLFLFLHRSVFSIQLTPDLPDFLDEDGTVIATDIGNSFWIFSTLYTTDDGFHPVSGNRLFGFTDNGDGTYSFFTRGVDRLSTSFYDWGNWLSWGLAFSTADELWSSFQEKIKDEIGSSATLDSTTYRPNYEKVDGVLDGSESPTVLGCN